MADLIHTHDSGHVKPLHIVGVYIGYLGNISIKHLPDIECGSLWDLVDANHASEGCIAWDMGELDIDELGNVERSVIIPDCKQVRKSNICPESATDRHTARG